MIAPSRDNGSKSPKRKCWFSDHVRSKAALTIIVFAFLACVTICFVCRDDGKVEVVNDVAQKRKIAEHTPTIPKPTKPASAEKPKPPPLGYENGIEILSLSARTNSAGAVIEKLKLADGTSKTKVHPKPPLFENPCDQVIAMAISTKPGDSMPPLPDLAGIDQDFANSLLNPIVIKDDDSDEVKNIKEMVMEVRKTLVEEVKNGKSVMDVLMAHQTEMNRIYESRLEAILMMQKISAEDGVEAAQEFADAVNDKFEEDGIPAIPVVGRGRNQQRNNRR